MKQAMAAFIEGLENQTQGEPVMQRNFVALVDGWQKHPTKLAQFHPRKKPDNAYPDYSKSLITQTHVKPETLGLQRGLGTGAVGAALTALIARMITNNPAIVAGGAIAGGAAGGALGYQSGKREANSEHTKQLALRRLGINTPGELFIASRMPSMSNFVTTPGVRV